MPAGVKDRRFVAGVVEKLPGARVEGFVDGGRHTMVLVRRRLDGAVKAFPFGREVTVTSRHVQNMRAEVRRWLAGMLS